MFRLCFPLAGLAAISLALAACQTGYPDRSPETARRVDDIRRNAADQKAAIAEREQRDRERLAFREQQIRAKHQVARDEAAIAHDEELAQRAADRRAIELRVAHDLQRQLNEARDRKRLGSDDQAATIDAEAASAAARVEADAAEELEPLASADRDAAAKLEQRILEIDRDEGQELSGVEAERAKVCNQARAERVKVDEWTSAELAELESAGRPTAERRQTRSDDERSVRNEPVESRPAP